MVAFLTAARVGLTLFQVGVGLLGGKRVKTRLPGSVKYVWAVKPSERPSSPPTGPNDPRGRVRTVVIAGPRIGEPVVEIASAGRQRLFAAAPTPPSPVPVPLPVLAGRPLPVAAPLPLIGGQTVPFSLSGLLSGLGSLTGGGGILGSIGSLAGALAPAFAAAPAVVPAVWVPPSPTGGAPIAATQVGASMVIPQVVRGAVTVVGALLARATAAVGKRVTTKMVWQLAQAVGITAAAASLGLSEADVGRIIIARRRRRSRGISASDLRRTRSTMRKMNTMRKQLKEFCKQR